MTKKVVFLILILSFVSCNPVTGSKKFQLERDNDFPIWLVLGDYSTDQTSGIAFIKTDERGYKNFLLADDIGVIHHLILSNDSIISLNKVSLSSELEDFFSVFPKKDFEEIIYDKYSNAVYLSVEGNLPAPEKFAGIFKLNFAQNNVLSDSIISVTKLDIKPNALFTKYLANNVSYEGVAVDENYLSASFSPPIRNAQYIRKKNRLIPAATPNPPLRVITPSGAPISIKITQAAGKAYFLWTSTQYLFISSFLNSTRL